MFKRIIWKECVLEGFHVSLWPEHLLFLPGIEFSSENKNNNTLFNKWTHFIEVHQEGCRRVKRASNVLGYRHSSLDISFYLASSGGF